MSNIRLASYTNKPISNNALATKELPSRIKIMNWGKNETLDDSIYLNDNSLKVFLKNQSMIGRTVDVPLDFDHCTVPNSEDYVKGGVRSIAGYGTPVLISGDGLYLENIKYTELGMKNARNYCDISPAPILNEKNEVVGLHSVALTPTGAIPGLTFYSAGLKMKELKSLVDEKEASNMIEKPEKNEKDELKKSAVKPLNTGMSGVVPMNTNEDSDEEEMDEDENEFENCMCANCKEAYNTYKVKRFANDAKKSIINNVDKLIGGEEKTKPLSAVVEMPNAYKNTEPATTTQSKIMFETMKQIAPTQLGAKSDAEILAILKELVAKWVGEQSNEGPITNKENSAVKSFAVRLEKLEQQAEETKAAHEAIERQEIIELASSEGKILPLSTDNIKKMEVAVLREMVKNLPVNKVPLKANTRVLNTDGKKDDLSGLSKASAAIMAQINTEKK